MFSSNRTSWIFAIGILSLRSGFAFADVKPASVFGDHMVLQREAAVPVWGTADAGEDVTVKAGEQSKSAKANEKGKWLVKLDALPVGGPIEVRISGKNSITFKDVLIGDVWICSGQSNMTFHLKQADKAAEEIAAANYPKIRLFNVKQNTSDTPLDSVTATWEACTPESSPDFSAVGYFFGRYIHEKIGVPVGLIHTSWGGTPAEAWTDEATLKADPTFAAALEKAKNYSDEYPKLLEQYEAAVKKAASLPKDAKKPLARKPFKPGENPTQPTVLYNAMIAPLQPYAIRGAIWYQGEANTTRAADYRKLLPAMIGDWRKSWGQGDFPFLIVQLANFNGARAAGAPIWAELREAQWLTAQNVPNAGIAATIEIGNPTNVHPTNKQEVGRRLGLVAEKKVYGKDVEDSGPVYSSMAIDGGAVHLKFDHLAGGLASHSEKLEGFTVAGEDKKFAPADAVIEGDTITLTCPSVPKPVAARYGWANAPTCTLYNKAGLPAFPFRTDGWPLLTANVH